MQAWEALVYVSDNQYPQLAFPSIEENGSPVPGDTGEPWSPCFIAGEQADLFISLVERGFTVFTRKLHGGPSTDPQVRAIGATCKQALCELTVQRKRIVEAEAIGCRDTARVLVLCDWLALTNLYLWQQRPDFFSPHQQRQDFVL